MRSGSGSDSDSSSSDSDSDDDEDDTAELMRELAKIKRERAEEKERQVSLAFPFLLSSSLFTTTRSSRPFLHTHTPR